MSRVLQLFEELKMTGALSRYEELSQSMKDREQFLLRLLDTEVQYRRERALKRRLGQAKFPVEKEWVELDRGLNPAIDLRALVMTTFWPAIDSISETACSRIFLLPTASPTPMFRVILVIFGTCITLAKLKRSWSCFTTVSR